MDGMVVTAIAVRLPDSGNAAAKFLQLQLVSHSFSFLCFYFLSVFSSSFFRILPMLAYPLPPHNSQSYTALLVTASNRRRHAVLIINKKSTRLANSVPR